MRQNTEDRTEVPVQGSSWSRWGTVITESKSTLLLHDRPITEI